MPSNRGKKKKVNNKDVDIKKISSESRRIKFRSDDFSIDSGTRFAEIVDEISMDSDEFIKALTDAIEAEVRVYFRYMERISHTLYSDLLDEEKVLSVKSNSVLSKYLDALYALDVDDTSVAEQLIEELAISASNSFFVAHLQNKLLMMSQNYKQAQKALQQLLQDSGTPLNKIELYTVLEDLEICCRENEDYKNAYRYASEKVELLEQLLQEY